MRVGIGGLIRDGVASFGTRPTFDNGAPLLEVHVFDFSGDLYGAPLDVAFIGWIRPELKFDSVEALVKRMDETRGLRARRSRAPAMCFRRSARSIDKITCAPRGSRRTPRTAKAAATASATGSDVRSATNAMTSGASAVMIKRRPRDAPHNAAVADGAEQRERHSAARNGDQPIGGTEHDRKHHCDRRRNPEQPQQHESQTMRLTANRAMISGWMLRAKMNSHKRAAT